MLKKAFIPYGGYYSSPFCRWQGSMQNENSIVLGAETSKRWLAEKGYDAGMFDYLYLGVTISQIHQFYAAPWAAALMGAGHVPGIALSQACTTGTTCVFQAAVGVETGLYQNAYVLTTDRTSNGPHTIWPNPKGPGGEVISENWLMDNFNADPNVGLRMIETAENVAREEGITKEACDATALKRYEQYLMALENDREFQKKYMFPAEIQISRKKSILVEEDEGITPATAEGLGLPQTIDTRRCSQFWCPDPPSRRQFEYDCHHPGKSQRTECRSFHADSGDRLRFLQGEKRLYGRSPGSGNQNGPGKCRPRYR